MKKIASKYDLRDLNLRDVEIEFKSVTFAYEDEYTGFFIKGTEIRHGICRRWHDEVLMEGVCKNGHWMYFRYINPYDESRTHEFKE